MAKRLFATFAGILSAVVLIGIIEWLNALFFPLPAGIDPSNAEQMAEAMRNAPTGVFVGLVAAWILGTLVGTAVAARLAPDDMKQKAALTVGAAVLAFTIINLVIIPGHPAWVWGAGLAGIAVASLVGLVIGKALSPKGGAG